MAETKLIIGGEWTPAARQGTYQVRNPARPDEVVGEAASGDAEDVERAVEAAHKAFPDWAALSFEERAEFLVKAAQHLTADEQELQSRIRLFTRENGKILKESALEMTRLGDRFLSSASFAERLARDARLPGPPFDTLITHQPRGVAALIIPWNWPLSILGGKLPQALIAGNTAVIKPASQSPLAPTLTIRRIAEIFPSGVVNLVTGSSSRIGDPLISHPLVRKINFTGGTETGRHVMRVASATLKHLTLELGGNDPAIVLEDAPLDEAAFQRMVMGAFLTAGQVCMALKRLYVHRSRFDEVVEGVTAFASKFVVGDGLDPRVSMGPLNNKAQLQAVQGMAEEARQKGAQVEEVGTVPDQKLFEKGFFHRPTIITGASPDLKVVCQEQFGPLMPILPFDDEDEAVQMANGSEFGLCSSVWTSDQERALRVARRLEAGYTYLNAHGPMLQDNRAPFGGFKQSGLGRNLGYEGILDFLEPHSISSLPGWLL